MKILRLSLYSFVLTVVNLGSIIIAFGIYHQFFRPVNQIAVQAPIAAILSIALFMVWKVFMHQYLPSGDVVLQEVHEFVWLYVLAFVWTPIIFIPVHFIFRGYVTSFGNILATWIFQLPVNFLTLLAAKKLTPQAPKITKSFV